MDTVTARRLWSREGRRLRRLARGLSNAVNSRHARIILLSRAGVSNCDIARGVGCTPQQVRRVIHRFNEGGVDAILWYPQDRSVAARKFDEATVERIAEIALSPPRQLIGMSVWSLSKLRAYLIEQGVVESISLEWLRHLLRTRGVRWRHTKTWKESKDPEFRPKYRRIRRLYDRRPRGGVRLCVDEFGPLNVQPRHGRHYARSGKPDRLRATYTRTAGVRYFFGVYDLERDTLTGRFYSQKNRVTFLSFLQWVRRRYRSDLTLHIVLDNVGYHLVEEVQAFAAANRIRFYLTPTSASWLNRIESHFTALRKFCLDNTDYANHGEQEAAIRDYLAWRNRRRRISVAAPTPTHVRQAA